MVESEWLDPTAADLAVPIGIGRRGRMVMKLLGRQAEFIDDYEPGKRSRTGQSTGRYR